jgi:PKD repeat protein
LPSNSNPKSHYLKLLVMKKITTILMLTLITGWFASFNTAQAQPACQAGFVYTTGSSGPGGTQVALYDSSWAAGTITGWSWNVNGNVVASTQNATLTLPNGSYYVCLTITAIYQGLSCTSSTCDTIVIGNGGNPCDANFVYNISPSGVQFNATGTNNTQWLWSFGDGTSSTAQNPLHVYSNPGTYTVCLTAVPSAGGQCQSCQTIVITGGGGGCQANFNAFPGGTPNTWDFINQSTGVSPGANWWWDFGDGNTDTSYNATHTYATGGLYLVCLNILDSAQNCFDVYCDSVFVQGGGTGCNATFAYQNAPSGVSFIANQQGAASYTWDFGDGSTGTGASVNHVYAPGTYNACLTVTMNGQTCTSCQTVTVQLNALCSSNFTVFPDSTQPHTYWALNMATGAAPLTYLWSWGDGTSSTGAYPTHTYSGPGLYTICLTITDANGCTSNTCNPYQLLRLSSSAPITINVINGLTGLQENEATAQVSVFPVPANDQVTAQFNLVKSADVSFRIFNTTGQMVQEVVAGTIEAGEQKLVIDTKSLTNGVYFLEAQIGNKSSYSKIVKQ